MCLSTAFKEVPGAENEKLCEYISEVKVVGDSVVMTDIMGKEIEVPGVIKSMDFVNSVIIIGA